MESGCAKTAPSVFLQKGAAPMKQAVDSNDHPYSAISTGSPHRFGGEKKHLRHQKVSRSYRKGKVLVARL